MCWLSTHLLPWTLEPAGYLQPQTGACRAEETQAGIQTLTSALQFSPYMKAEAGACPQPQHQTSENPQQSTIEQPQLPKSCCWRNTAINPALSLGRRRCPSHHSTRAAGRGLHHPGWKTPGLAPNPAPKGSNPFNYPGSPADLISLNFPFAQVPQPLSKPIHGDGVIPSHTKSRPAASPGLFPADARAGSYMKGAAIFCWVHSVQGLAPKGAARPFCTPHPSSASVGAEGTGRRWVSRNSASMPHTTLTTTSVPGKRGDGGHGTNMSSTHGWPQAALQEERGKLRHREWVPGLPMGDTSWCHRRVLKEMWVPEGGAKPRSWECILQAGPGSRGYSPGASSLPHSPHPPSGYFAFLKWLFAGPLAEGGTGFKCI